MGYCYGTLWYCTNTTGTFVEGWRMIARVQDQPGRGAPMVTVVLLGTLDTKGAEYAYLARRVRCPG